MNQLSPEQLALAERILAYDYGRPGAALPEAPSSEHEREISADFGQDYGQGYWLRAPVPRYGSPPIAAPLLHPAVAAAAAQHAAATAGEHAAAAQHAAAVAQPQPPSLIASFLFQTSAVVVGAVLVEKFIAPRIRARAARV